MDLTPYLPKEDVYPIGQDVLDALLYSGSKAVVSDQASINAMLANDEPEVEIIINDDMAVSAPITIEEGKSAIIDLDGNDLTRAATRGAAGYVINVSGGDLLIKNGSVSNTGRAVLVQNGGTVTFENVNVSSSTDVAVDVTGADSKLTMESGKITAQESGVLITTNAAFEMNGGEIECWDNCPIQGNGTVKPDNDQGHIDVVMNGGKLVAHIQSNGYTACGVYMPNSGKFTMNGGEIISDGAGLVMRAGEVELNGGSITAKGVSDFRGKVGDSRVVVGPYAIVYDESAKYPGVANGEFKLTIGKDMILAGTDGNVETLLSEGATANIIDNRA